jgi:hypothetical protein
MIEAAGAEWKASACDGKFCLRAPMVTVRLCAKRTLPNRNHNQ